MAQARIPSAESALKMSSTETQRSVLADRLILATMIPQLDETISLLELGRKRPSSGLFYDFGSLLNINWLLPEYQEFRFLRGPGCSLPKKVRGMELEGVLLDEKKYINRILDLAGQAGYRTAWVLKSGIIFFLHPNQMGQQSQSFYRNFFLTREQIHQHIIKVIKSLINGEVNRSRRREILNLKIQDKPLNHISLKFPYCFTPENVQLINYEMSIHYQKMNFSSYIYSDSDQLNPHDLETPIEPTTLKIFFHLDRIIDQLI